MSKNLMSIGLNLHEEENERGEWYVSNNSIQFVRLKGGAFVAALGGAGAIGALIASLIQRAKITVDIPYSDILSVTLESYKNEKKALCIETKNNRIYASVDKPEVWLNAIQEKANITPCAHCDNRE